MANPAYLYAYDEHNQLIHASVQKKGREGSALVYGFKYAVSIPTDTTTGMLTGIRQHHDAIIHKQLDAATPVLFDACARGKTLQRMKLDWYHINPQGQESIYLSHLFTDVKVVLAEHALIHQAQGMPEHQACLHLRFRRIDVHYLEGNIKAFDDWLEDAGQGTA